MVASVEVGSVTGLVFATQNVGNFSSEPSENQAVGINDMPFTLDFARSYSGGSHRTLSNNDRSSSDRRNNKLNTLGYGTLNKTTQQNLTSPNFTAEPQRHQS